MKAGDRARITGNNTEGLRHYLEVGKIVEVLEDRTHPAARRGYEQPSYVVCGASFVQNVHQDDLEPLAPKLKVGDRVRLIHDGAGHHDGPPVGTVSTVTSVRESRLSDDGCHVTTDCGFSGFGERFELVGPADALDCLTTRKTRRAVLAKVLQRLDEDYAGVATDEDSDAHTGVVDLVTQLGYVAQAVHADDFEQAHFELVRLAADCLSWLEDAEEQGADDSL